MNDSEATRCRDTAAVPTSDEVVKGLSSCFMRLSGLRRESG